MTPEYAKLLLAGDFGTQIQEDWVGNSQAGFTNFDGPFIETTPGDLALTEAAPILAERVASMRMEYAVQYLFHGEWQDTRYRRDTKQEAELVRRLYPQYDTRVVRRLTTEWEEVE